MKINVFRRWLMQALTHKIGKSSDLNTTNDNIKRVLISRPNGRLGNLILITPLIQEITAQFPNSTIDLFVKGNAAPFIFQTYPQIDQIISLPAKPFSSLPRYAKTWLMLRKHQYDLAVNVIENSSSGRLSLLFSKANIKIYGKDRFTVGEEFPKHIAKTPVAAIRQYHLIFTTATDAIPILNLQLSRAELYEGKTTLLKIVNNNKPTICLFTYATGAKCYPKDWWKQFYKELALRYPTYNIIEILPAHNESNIDYQAPAFYSKDIRAIAGLIANTQLFIGADSGMMHLASASQATVIGLFSVTDANKYKPYGNNSFALDTNQGSLSDWLELIDKRLTEKSELQK